MAKKLFEKRKALSSTRQRPWQKWSVFYGSNDDRNGLESYDNGDNKNEQNYDDKKSG